MTARKSQVEKALKADAESDKATTRADRARAEATFAAACRNTNTDEQAAIFDGLMKKWTS